MTKQEQLAALRAELKVELRAADDQRIETQIARTKYEMEEEYLTAVQSRVTYLQQAIKALEVLA